MKKLLLIFLALMLLSSCTNKQEKEDDEQISLIDEYVENMEDYEILEISFLGVLNAERNIEDIIERIKDYDELKIANELLKENSIYGNHDIYTNVYLIIPNKNVDITIGKYNSETNDMGDIWFKFEEAKPFIYYEEENDSFNPEAIISYVKGDIYGNLLTGFSTNENRLRTEFQMGIVDNTPYDIFTSSEIPYYDQAFFDLLMSFDEVTNALNDGMDLLKMGEINYLGNYYAIFYLSDANDNVYKCYGIHFSTECLSVIESDNFIDWTEIMRY